MYDGILLAELGDAGAPPYWKCGCVARVLREFGTDKQRTRFLGPALRSEERWCQGFSEPDAGSDLANLRTRAAPDDGDYVLNGQKVWTSDAKWADWCLVLARTDPDAPRHRGISCFVVRLDAPGVTVRPFENIIGSFEFAEVFFDDVRVPATDMLGAPGDGWRVAMATVSLERGPTDNGFIAEHRRTLRRLRERDLQLEDHDVEAVGRSIANVEVLALHVAQTLWRRVQGLATDAESSIDKLLMTATEQELGHTVYDIDGAAVLTHISTPSMRDYLWSRAASIYGGTSQVQRNIVATRLLGLPRGGA
jgi:alkylation response protein AidB-like acyl-CoA dehydrogenase